MHLPTKATPPNAEQKRLAHNAQQPVPLAKWGPYLSERQWGTVREDYSSNGDAWNYFSHDQARSRTYLWGEDGLAGISDYFQNLCFAIALWNYKDPILKERLFGLTNGEGNHGEDVKELYYYLDNVPSHAYMQYLYKYPQAAYPYGQLIDENKRRSKADPEFEILDTDAFKDSRYFDVSVAYAKQDAEDIFIKIEVTNRGDAEAPICVLPTLWFYNRWQYGGLQQKPLLRALNEYTIEAVHERLGTYYLYHQAADDLLFTENESNNEKLFGLPNESAFVKDAFHDAIIHGHNIDALRQKKEGTKCAPVYHFKLAAGASATIILRLTNGLLHEPFATDVEALFRLRRKEADEFYDDVIGVDKKPEIKNILRQAYAGLLWNKQYYHLDLERWLHKSNGISPITAERLNGRNRDWIYLKNQDVIVMPDKWEYPWYAAWDTAFHCIPLADIDPVFAKNQLLLLMKEWYMNPQGQLPAYEWNFSDVNPPVQAFCALEIYSADKRRNGAGDIDFLKRAFQKLIINFAWWANREDANGNNVFEGGFLGLDNIGLFNRSNLAAGALLEQADGTSWMGMYALNMMDMALEIATEDPSFEDSCTKFYEHFVLIAEALNDMGLWNEEDRFFYDKLSINKQGEASLKVRSIVGLIPLLAVSVVSRKKLDKLTDFKKRMGWVKTYRALNNKYFPNEESEKEDSLLLSLVHRDRLLDLLKRLLDETEFLSPHGIRALSKYHAQHPYHVTINSQSFGTSYDPGDATSDLYGGNSNWRGPVWMPVNYLLIKALRKYASFYGDEFTVECPVSSGQRLNVAQVANELTERLFNIFHRDESGNRPVYGEYNWFYGREENKDLLLFHEYFHGDNGRGLGASHQTGWSALIACLLSEEK